VVSSFRQHLAAALQHIETVWIAYFHLYNSNPLFVWSCVKAVKANP